VYGVYNMRLLHCRSSLKHQRVEDEKKKTFITIADWYKKSGNGKVPAKKFHMGVCTFCGAMTHKAKNCLDVSVIDCPLILYMAVGPV